MKHAHESIIVEEKFEQVQAEMKKRSNIEMAGDTRRRKNTHYCAKRDDLLISMPLISSWRHLDQELNHKDRRRI